MAAELLCCERSCECRAYFDPRLLRDSRVLENLLKTEELYTTNSSYFQCVQSELTPDMRKIVVEWMLEVCEEQKCTEEVFVLSVNFLDRFLSVVPLTKAHLQLAASVCLLMASKLREPNPLSARLLVHYTDYSICIDHIPKWEILIAAKLKWNLSAVTASDFLGHLLYSIPLEHDTQVMVRRHAQTFIFLSAREFKFCMYTASIVAGAAIAAALKGLQWCNRSGWTMDRLTDHLTKTLGVEKDYLQTCLRQMEDMINETISVATAIQEENKMKSGTPTDIHDIDF